MKFKSNSDMLQKAINITEKAIAPRSSLPILENMYLSLDNTTLKCRGNDLELGIEYSIPVEGDTQDGSILVKAKTMSSIISKLNNQQLEVTVTNQQLMINGDNINFDIHGESASDYPVFPDVASGVSIILSVNELKSLIRHTVFSVSFDDTKKFLNGIFIKNDQDKLLFVATDGYRLSFKSHVITPLSSEFNVIAPYKAVNELNKILQGVDEDKQIEMIISDNQIAFKMDTFLLVSRVIQGQFPDYNQVIPKSSEYSYKVSRKALLEAAERASIIASSSNNVVKFLFNQEGVTITASAPGLGEFKELLALQGEVRDVQSKIALNIRLLLDVVKVIDADELTFSFNNELSPCKLTSVSDPSFTYIIMPIRTSDFQANSESVSVDTTVSNTTVPEESLA
jgi:DNA polymerase-3 subunit beta